ncbi:glycosyltransferase family 4 protein [Rivularia sp. UHCC 0363]|uniref:glycosyltransferase family 4 protein n=1 Tax=Rivularia sp. UHCC 0363 TaxID=3110244 RepID=UPI002B21A260|nr:glycosyltransferase family 4 protein [Rivularia sp. UHCC 0363]MEA5597650.1 glycosyltransferase family 4 protein [Rivularia sp. UHCC 0363]
MKNLLIITTIPDTLTAFLIPFARHFRAQGWQVDAMACGISAYDKCKDEFDHLWEVQWSRNPLNPRNLLVAPRQIQAAVQQGKYDIVHVHTPVAAFVTRYALKNYRKLDKTKVIYTAHGFHFHNGGTALKNIAFLSLEKIAGSWTDYLVTINREDEQAAIHHQLISSQKVLYMPGIGVDLDYYSYNTTSQAEVEEVRQELDLPADAKLLLSVAEFIPRKHPQDILRAFASINRSDTCLAFAGDGDLFSEMQQLAFQLGIQEKVRFLGHRNDIPTLMRTAFATILASEQEGLPRSVMESLSLETPVIGSDIRGTKDLVSSECGILFPVGNVEKLADAIKYLLNHPQSASIMGKRGREHMKNFDLRHIIKLHETLYAEVLSLKS